MPGLEHLSRLAAFAAFLADAWSAFSPVAAAVGVSGLALVLVAILGLTALPARLRRPALALGAALIVVAGLYQVGLVKGALEEHRRTAAAAIAAEATRTAFALALGTRDRAQAARDLASQQAHSRVLQEALDAAARDPQRDSVCLPRSVARGLRR